jgi:hypothetical protein
MKVPVLAGSNNQTEMPRRGVTVRQKNSRKSKQKPTEKVNVKKKQF